MQRTDEWFADRVGKVTASRFADVMTSGRSKDVEFGEVAMKYAYEIVSEIMTGERKEGYTSQSMEWGISHEAAARELYEITTFNKVKLTGYIPMTERIGGSPDGLVGADGGVEIKCPDSTTHLNNILKKECPKIYVPQIQGYLWITGRKWFDFVSYDPRYFTNQIVIVRVNRDEDYIKQLSERIDKFLKIVDNILQKVR